MTKDEYQKLVREIQKYNQAYEDGNPVITDLEYDQLMSKLKAAEKEDPALQVPDSPSLHAGAPVKRKSGVTVEHDVPMLSIEDVFTKEAVIDWVHQVRSVYPDAGFSVEQKIDGLSMSLVYENGRLKRAETRGDGYTGEDVTVNARVIPDVIDSLGEDTGRLEVRGEVYMTISDFEHTNEMQELLGKKTFANPRNCAAGTLRQLSPAVTKERGLSFFVFNVQKAEDLSFMQSHTEDLHILSSRLGMKTVPSSFCTTDEEILAEIDRIGSERGEYGYDIDGCVVKIDQIRYREAFPSGSKYTPGHIAYKYPPEEKETVIRDIEVTVGMTGRMNPTAVFDPVRLCGTTVSRATLHNQAFIDKLHIGIGDTVIVYKSGEIIPKIKEAVRSKRPAGVTDFRLPDRCPACGSETVREEGASDRKCINPDCPAQLERHLINFAGRSAMDIKGFGVEIIKALIKDGYLKGLADIYTLKDHRSELIEKGLTGREKNTDKLLSAIEKSKNNDPSRLLTGMAIPNVGQTSSRTIIAHFGSMERLMQATHDELIQVEDIGGITADSILQFFGDKRNVELIGTLKKEGLRMEAEMSASEQPAVLAGRTYVITGDVVHFKNRAALTSFITDRGGKVAGSVSGKTYALINNDMTSVSGKNKRARELGIPILSEEAFLNSLGADPTV